MAQEKTCPRHGRHERRQCPACVWCADYPNRVRFESGCPMCGEPLDDNTRMVFFCTNDACPMMSTSHPPPPLIRRRVQPEDVGLRGRRL